MSYRPVHQGDSVTLVITGELAQGCKAHTYLALLDHPQYAAGTVRAIWRELGGTLLGANRIDRVPEDARLLVRAESPDLVEVIRDINKYSNNTMARQLFLSLGAAFRTGQDSDDAAAAQRVIRQWLERKGLPVARLVLENGSGLSRSERVTARGLASLLQSAWQSPFAAEFISSMPLAALDGTMRKRLQDTAVAGKAHIKTGTLNNVRAIAGYSRDVNGSSWAVVAILNHPRPGALGSAGPGAAVDIRAAARAAQHRATLRSGRQAHLIATCALGCVERGVGTVEQIIGGFAGMPLRYAKTGGDAPHFFDRFASQQRPQRLGQGRRLGQAGLGAQHGEFLTTQPAQQVATPQARSQPLAARLQYPVTGGVAKLVVDLLEMVDIEHQQ